jgi:small subunit ribosomal protein S17
MGIASPACVSLLGDPRQIVNPYIQFLKVVFWAPSYNLGICIMDTQENKVMRRELTGKVVSNKMTKTVVVEVERKVLHPKYKKYVRQSNKYHAHDETNECQINDEVVIREARPMSKLKRWTVVERRNHNN